MSNKNSDKDNLEDSGFKIFWLSLLLVGAMVAPIPGIIGTVNVKFNLFFSYSTIILCIFFSNSIKIDFSNFSEVTAIFR